MKRLVIALLLATSMSLAALADVNTPIANLCVINRTASLLNPSAQHLDPDVLKLALTAYNCAVLAGLDKRQVLTVINYTLPSDQPRLWVFDLVSNRILFNSLVAHGQGSGEKVADRFSDNPNSHESSIGLFLTGETYVGHNGNSLKLYGLEKDYNDNALSRDIVVHGADYVNQNLARSTGKIGRSWGCPAVPRDMAQPIIEAIKGGSIVFSYYPDPNWLLNSKYLHCSKDPNYSVNIMSPM